MNKQKIGQLLDISSEPIGSRLIKNTCPSGWSGLKQELHQLLYLKNGFFAFESALLVRPLSFDHKPLSLEKWNKSDLWLDNYKIKIPELFFFAEDIFGGQFAIFNNTIVSFDPETGEIEEISDSLEGWAKEILSDYDYLTGTLSRTNGKRQTVKYRVGIG